MGRIYSPLCFLYVTSHGAYSSIASQDFEPTNAYGMLFLFPLGGLYFMNSIFYSQKITYKAIFGTH
jgi:hypothetical protein